MSSILFFQKFLSIFWIFILTNRTMDKVDETMNAVNEQRELANEIAETIANPIYTADIDEVCDLLEP